MTNTRVRTELPPVLPVLYTALTSCN